MSHIYLIFLNQTWICCHTDHESLVATPFYMQNPQQGKSHILYPKSFHIKGFLQYYAGKSLTVSFNIRMGG